MRKTDKNQKRYFLLFLLDAGGLFFCWGGFFRSRLANSDTLWGNIDPGATLVSRLSNFRWLGYVGDSFSYDVLHYFPFQHRVLSFVLFLVVLAVSLFLLQLTFLRSLGADKWGRGEQLLFFSATSLCFVNVLSAELFYFTESYLIFKAAFLMTMAGCFLFGRKHYVSGTIFLFLAPMFYQMSCIYAALVLCTLAYLEERGEGSLRLIRKEFCYLTAAMMGGILNYLTGPWLDQLLTAKIHYDILPSKQMQGGSFRWLAENLLHQFRDLYESSLGLMMPLWIPLLFSAAVTILVIVLITRTGKKRQLWIYLLYKVVAFVFMCGIQVVSTPDAFTCRVIAPFYTMQAMNVLVAMFWLQKKQNEKPEKKETALTYSPGCRKLLKKTAVLTTGYLLIQCFFIQIIISNRILSEDLDILYADQVLDLVEKYEQETEERVTGTGFCTDSSWSAYYDQVNYCHSAVNSRVAGAATYSLIETVAEWRGMHLERGEMNPAVYEKYFAGKNWDHFDPEEQVVIQNGVLYWCVF